VKPAENFSTGLAAEVADTIQAGKTIPFQVHEQVFGGKNAKFPASLDDTLRKAEPVQRGIQ